MYLSGSFHDKGQKPVSNHVHKGRDICQDKGKSWDRLGRDMTGCRARMCSQDSIPLPLTSALSALALLLGKVSAAGPMAALHTALLHLAFLHACQQHPATVLCFSACGLSLATGTSSGCTGRLWEQPSTTEGQSFKMDYSKVNYCLRLNNSGP